MEFFENAQDAMIAMASGEHDHIFVLARATLGLREPKGWIYLNSSTVRGDEKYALYRKRHPLDAWLGSQGEGDLQFRLNVLNAYRGLVSEYLEKTVAMSSSPTKQGGLRWVVNIGRALGLPLPSNADLEVIAGDVADAVRGYHRILSSLS
jgi:hypothetical protein